MSAGKDKEINYFLTEMHFPEAKSMFSFQPKSLEAIKNDCVVVLDTNVLLLPYTVRSKSLDEIKTTLKDLIQKEKLLLPGQVVREFAKNRPNKLSELFQQVSDFKSKIVKVETPKYPLLEKLAEYNEAFVVQEKINNLINEYKGKIDTVLQYIKELNWDDHVSSMYSELFSEQQVIEFEGNKERLVEEFQTRSHNNIPPAFKDKNKTDGGIGDFLIWKTILQIGNEKKCNLLFVTADEKNDWFHQSMKQALYPRYELIQEYKMASQGATFRIISLSGLLELYGANEEVVDEIKNIENEIIIENKSNGSIDDEVVIDLSKLASEGDIFYARTRFDTQETVVILEINKDDTFIVAPLVEKRTLADLVHPTVSFRGRVTAVKLIETVRLSGSNLITFYEQLNDKDHNKILYEYNNYFKKKTL